METKSLPNGWGLNSDPASPHLRIFYPWFATLPQSPGCGARSCFPKLPSASPICPRPSASPPEAHEMNVLYLCGRSLEWANWKLGLWVARATDAKEIKESEQPQFVCLYKPSLRFRTSTCTSTVRWPTPAHYPSPVLSASTTLRLYLDEPYATNQFI